MHGDHTPLALGSPNLTPVGANQMYDQGAAFRNRYLRPSRHDEYVGIVGISFKTIDNSQLHIEASTESYSSASAIAFMQGLYPPFPHTTCDRDVPEHNYCANGSMLNYPMCGYQYPNIRAIAPDRDPDSIWYVWSSAVSGASLTDPNRRSHAHGLCNKHENSLLMFANNSMADAMHQESEVFYDRLWNTLFCDAFPRSETNFFNAHDLYDYALYRWNHDSKSRSSMTSGEVEKLQELAWQEQTLKYANVSGSGNGQDELTSAIAGRTLASRASALFAENIDSHGERNKLNLAFTSHEPFLAFFALAGLTTGPSSHLFSQLPDPGATLTFELFSIDSDETADSYGIDPYGKTDSYNNDNSYSNTHPRDEADSYSTTGSYHGKSRRGYDGKKRSTYDRPYSPYNTHPNHNKSIAYPPEDKLYVRFLYWNDASKPRVPPTLGTMFESSYSSMSFKHFNEIMSSIGIANATSWCGVCESDALFCKGAELHHDHHHH
jgi:hypothetical protein